MYNNIRAQIKAESNKHMQDQISYMKDSENTLEHWSTRTRWNQYQQGIINHEQVAEYAEKRIRKTFEKQAIRFLSRLNAAEKAPDVVSVEISVEWTKSRVWGYNPQARVRVYMNGGWEEYTGAASGCGYDKESAAVAEALDKCPSIIKMLCDKKEAAILDSATPSAGSRSNEKYIHYGAGYGAIPYFEGGVGMSSLRGVFEACGYKLETESHGKSYDYYCFATK